MLLGVFLYRVGFFKKGFTKKQLLKVSLTALLFTSIEITLSYTFPVLKDEMSSEMANVSAIFVALLYAHIIITLVNNRNRFINTFSAPGKLALTLYILQSISMAMLLRFSNQEFHLTAERLDYVLIALVFTLVQLGLAHWYLRYFTQGPLEYLWREVYWRSFEKTTKLVPKPQHT